MTTALTDQLRAGVQVLGLALDEDQITRLLDFQNLLQKWTKVYNLTAVRDPQEMLTHHLLDSLAVVGPLRRQTGGHAVKLLDVGSGAGLPGVVMAICCPEVDVHCVDTVAKKASFIRQVAAELRLSNLQGLHARVETLTDPYDLVSARAFASLGDFVRWSAGCLAPGGVWMAMKGKHPAQELAELPPQVQVFHVEPLTVPGLDAERRLVWMKVRA